jgi:acrylyl-CoA reductase (NADPH)
MGMFKAIVIDKSDAGQQVGFRGFDEADLMDGDVTVRVSHSTLNYKDGLALTGKAPVVRRFPMIPGVDLVGVVEDSSSPDFKAGDAVVLNGWGLGETQLGAYAEKVRVKSDWLIPLPQDLTPLQAMAIGTAGYTAMLCLMAIERHGSGPESGPAIVTGAVGGVGSVAVALFAQAGWHVIASTGRPEEGEYLKGLGAAEILDRSELTVPVRPLSKERWAAGVDTVGSVPLANVLSMTKYGGAIAACGLAAGMDLPTTVAPFILRNVALLGVDSVMAPKTLRMEAWGRLARELDHGKLAAMTSIISLDDVIEAGQKIVAGQIKGRVVVEIG